jgi:hypothetical protein
MKERALNRSALAEMPLDAPEHHRTPSPPLLEVMINVIVLFKDACNELTCLAPPHQQHQQEAAVVVLWLLRKKGERCGVLK